MSLTVQEPTGSQSFFQNDKTKYFIVLSFQRQLALIPHFHFRSKMNSGFFYEPKKSSRARTVFYTFN